MKHLVVMVACALALAGCKKDDKKAEPPAAGGKDQSKVEHGKAGGKGAGGGEKTATGSKDSKQGSGKPAADPKVIERGKYLAALGGCASCHTPMGPDGPDFSKSGGGGMKVTEKFPGGEFTWIGANITSHDNGIGTWTDEQVMIAIREGVRPDGRKLLPIMPYPLYNSLTDDDTRALVAFLRTLPPVDSKIEQVDNKLPPEAYPPVGKPPNTPIPDDTAGKGAYYAAIMHCVMCHTPMTDQGPDMSKAFAGGFPMELPPEFGTGVLYSSNITSDPATGIGKWTEAQIIDAVRKATRPDGKPILGPMMFYVPSWSQMTDDDAMALATFIKALPPVKNKVPASTFKMAGPPGGPPAK